MSAHTNHFPVDVENMSLQDRNAVGANKFPNHTHDQHKAVLVKWTGWGWTGWKLCSNTAGKCAMILGPAHATTRCCNGRRAALPQPPAHPAPQSYPLPGTGLINDDITIRAGWAQMFQYMTRRFPGSVRDPYAPLSMMERFRIAYTGYLPRAPPLPAPGGPGGTYPDA